MNFIQNIDDNIINNVYNFMSNSPILVFIFNKITILGDNGFIWISIGLILLIKKTTRKFGVIMLISLLIGNMFGNAFLKNLIGRNRPFIQLNFEPFIKPPFGYSFPSGHSLSSFAGATSIFHWNKKLGILALILATLIAISRVMLCVHYVSDILVGSVLGVLISFISYNIFKKMYFLE